MTAAGDTTRSRSELVAALPRIRQLAEQLHEAVRDAMITEDPIPEARAIYQAATAVQWLTSAMDADTVSATVDQLTEVTARSGYIAEAAQSRMAELQDLDELAAAEDHRRSIAYETDAIIDSARLDTGLPTGANATITVSIADGRATWHSDTLTLEPVDGPAQLAITTALTLLGETLTRALPQPAQLPDQP